LKGFSLLPTIATVLLLVSAVPSMSADQLVLNNGDRLSGTLVELRGGALTFTTDYAAEVKIAASAVSLVETDHEVELRLQSDEVLIGKLKTENGRLRVAGSDIRSATSLSWDEVKSINVPFAVWGGGVWLGGSQVTGNTERQSVNFGAEATRASETDRWNFSLLYNYAREDGDLSTRNTYAVLKYDRFFSQRFYGYLSVEMLKDKFKDLNLRTIVGPGIGYQFWDKATRALALEAGAAYFSEDRRAGDDKQWATGRLAAKFRLQLSDSIRFSDHLILYPRFQKPGEGSLRNDAALVTSLGSSWSLRIAHLWEHDSQPAEGVKNNDFTTSVNLQYSF
jgi:putative salt-induced outer membrane protein YdiY